MILESEPNSDNFTGVTNTDVFSTGLDASSVSVVEVIDDEDDEDKSALGRKTMTVLPTVVTNSSNPKTVLVVTRTPENCHNQSRQLYNTRSVWKFAIYHTIYYLPAVDDEDGLATGSVEEVEDGTEN